MTKRKRLYLYMLLAVILVGCGKVEKAPVQVQQVEEEGQDNQKAIYINTFNPI